MTSMPLSPRVVSILLPVLLLAGLGEGFYSYRLTRTQRNIEAVVNQHGETLEKLSHGLAQVNEGYADLQGEVAFTKDRLGTTQVELRKTERSSSQLARQQKETARKWGSQFGQLQQQQTATQGAVGNLSTDVAGVKTGLSSTNEQLASTRTDLQRTIGDLGVQSGLIARNRTELDELRLRGERDYYEFELSKSKQSQRVGNIGVALRKTDLKRQRYTINLLSDDRTIEKKDKTVDEPVQFYQAGNRQPSEIVVNQIRRNRISGYLSVPKQKETRPAASQAAAASSGGLVADHLRVDTLK